MNHASAAFADTPPEGRRPWRVALSLTLLYYPVLVYLNYVHWGEAGPELLRTLPPVLSGAAVMLLVFRGWVQVMTPMQRRLHQWLGEDFSLEMRWSAQLLTIALCLGMSLGFSLLYEAVMLQVDSQLARAGVAVGLGGAGNGNQAAAYHSLQLWYRSLHGYFLLLLLSVFYLLAGSRTRQQLLATAYKGQQLEMQNVQVQLAALKNQVNPHFLFNSLSILTSLVHVDVALSEKFIHQLARAYRYTLEQQEHDVVALGTELSFIQSYTFLLKIRFKEKFDVVLDVPEAVRTRYHIAPLTLQLLIENAVKHNTMSLAKPLRVHIGLEGETLVVCNTVQPRLDTYDSTGVGLQNILNRYRLLTDRSVQVSEAAGTFTVKIPLLPA